MPRQPREVSVCDVYHFMSRGVHRKELFHASADYSYYLDLTGKYARKLQLEIFHYCLMPNHTHFLVKADEISRLSCFAHYVQREYVFFYRKKYNWSGQVFQRCFASKPINDDIYLLECGRYIERNPLDAGLVQDLALYPYSSYTFYAHATHNLLITPSPAYNSLSINLSERRSIYKFYVAQMRPKLQETAKSTLPF